MEHRRNALASGDGLTAAGSVVQMLVLVLMTGGLVFFLFTLARSLFRKGWEWSRPTWPRRLAGGLATMALAAVMVVLFAPALPLIGGSGPPRGPIDFSPIRPGERMTVQDMSRQLLTGERASDGGTDGGPAGGTEVSPTVQPSSPPEATPSGSMSPSPTSGVTATARPTPTPTATPTSRPTPTPTATPTATPMTESGTPAPTTTAAP